MGVLHSFVWNYVKYAKMEGFYRDSHICYIELLTPNSSTVCILGSYSTGNQQTVLYWVVLEWLQ